MKALIATYLELKIVYSVCWGILIIAFGVWPAMAYETGDPIRLNFSIVPETMDPTQCWLVEHLLIVQSTSQSLVRIDQAGALVGDIAEKWEISNDKKTYTFFISEKAKFHDGSKITSADVARSISSHFKKGSPSIVARYLRNAFPQPRLQDDILCNISLVNDSVFRIRLDKPFQPFLFALSMGNFSVYKQINGKMILSGPMKPDFDEITRTWHLTSTVDENKIIIKEVPEFKDAIKDLQANKVDALIGYPINDALKLESDEQIAITKAVSMATAHFYFNINRAPFNNIDFRRDLSSLIQNYTRKHDTSFTKYEPYFIPKEIMPAEYYNPINHKLLKPKEFKNKGYRPNDVNLVINRTAFPDDFIYGLKGYLKSAGIHLNLHIIDNGQLFAYLKSKDYDIIGGRFMGGFPDPEGFLNSISDNQPVRYGTFPTNGLMRRISQVKESENRERLISIAKLLRVFEENHYIIPLFRLYLPIIHQKNLKIPPSEFRFMLEIWRITY